MDSYVERRHKSFGTNLKDALVGVLIGIVMFIGSFPLLWWNEGRLDMSKVAKTALILNPGPVDPAANQKWASITAPVTVGGTLEDPIYINPGQYLSLSRHVEMYAWVEKKTTEEKKNVGGSSEEVTRYDYYKEWVSADRVAQTSSFKVPSGHENPTPRANSETFYASQAMTGQYSFNPKETQLPEGFPLLLNTPGVLKPGFQVDGNYIYVSIAPGAGSISVPNVGDIKISFKSLPPPATGTLFGYTNGASMTPYVAEDGDSFIRLFMGDRESAIALMSAEHTLTTWLIRGGGFLLMWIGMLLFFGPINTVLDILPFLGSAGRFLVGVATFPIALVLSIVTIFIAIVFHNVFLLLGFFFLLGLFIAWRSLGKKPKA